MRTRVDPETISVDQGTCVTTQSLANILGITQPRVIQLTTDGILVRETGNKYNLIQNVKLFLQYKTAGKGGTNLDAERVNHEKIKSEIDRLKLEKEKGNLHSTDVIQKLLDSMVTAFKQRMLAVPSKFSAIMEGKSKEEINEILKDEITTSLFELSNLKISNLAAETDDDLGGNEERNTEIGEKKERKTVKKPSNKRNTDKNSKTV